MRRFTSKVVFAGVGALRVPRRTQSGPVDPLGVCGGSVLGTGSLSEILRDLRDAKPVVDDTTFAMGQQNLTSELGHMESPDADARLCANIDKTCYTLLDSKPLPADPMTAALLKSEDEQKACEVNEALVEAVRMRYKMRKEREAVEEERVLQATARLCPTDHATQQRILRERKEEAIKKRIARLKAELAAAEDELCVP